MLLMDTIGQWADIVGEQPQTWRIGVFQDMVERLEGTPRFLLDEAATRTVVELTLSRPKIVREAMAHLVIPYPRLWVEWPEEARAKLRQTFQIDNFERPDRPVPERLGFLVEADEDSSWNGRRGQITWVWRSRQFPMPNIGPIVAKFDLDQTFPARLEGDISAMTNNLALMWKDSAVQYEAFTSIWRTAQHIPSEPFGVEYFRAASRGAARQLLADSTADVFGEYITAWAVLLLLTADRPVINLTPVDLGRLNKRRSKRRERPLLDYTQVTMRLSPPEFSRVVRGPLGHDRKSPRLHMVSSYLGRRGNKHYIVQPYWRGKGGVIHRRVSVRG